MGCHGQLFWCFAGVILAAKFLVPVDNRLVLTSDPSPSSGSFCGGPVVFTCRGIDISIIQEWRLNNDTVISVYSFDFTHTFPRNVTLMPQAPAVMVQITDASGMVGSTSVNTTSTLSVSDVSILNESFLHCQDRVLTRSNTIDIFLNDRPPPPPPAPSCTIVTTSGPPVVTFQWSNDFNVVHAVEHYRVTVTPDPLFCSSDQVPPSEDYSCSGLELGTDYSITFSAINCEEGRTGSYGILLQVPETPTGLEVNTEQDLIEVEWIEVAAPLLSSNCTIDSNISISYVVIWEDNSGRGVPELTVFSDSCSNGLCSINFSTSAQYCRVGVRASNGIGNSTTEYRNIGAAKLTLSNSALLGLGVVFLIVAIAIVVAIIFLAMKGDPSCEMHCSLTVKILIILCLLLTLLVPVVLWVAVGFQVGLQDNTCDSAWQSARDDLIISTFFLSALAVIAAVIAIPAMICIKKRQPFKEMKMKKRQPFKEMKMKKRQPLNSNSPGKDDRELVNAFRGKQVDTTPARINVQEEWYQKERAEEEQKKKDFEENQKRSEKAKKEGETEPGESHMYSTTTHAKPAGVETPPASTDYSQLGGETNNVYSVPIHDTGSAQPTFTGQTYDTLAKVPCKTMLKRVKYYHRLAGETNPSRIAAWFTETRRWLPNHLSETLKLKVFFMNDYPKHWKCRDTEELMKFLEESWTNCFTLGDKESQIRVKFEDTDFSNWTVIGFPSTIVDKNKATMSLNFRNMNKQEIRAMVIHQFGHALGLGHALMRPEDWADIEEYVDVEKMARDSHDEDRKDVFESEWTGKQLGADVLLNYDEKSVMQYSSSSLWLKNVTPIPEVVKEKLQKFLQHEHLLNTELSDGDKGILKLMKKAMTPKDLGFLKSKRGEFNLTHELSSIWEAVGERLKVKQDLLDEFRISDESDDERLNKIWIMWTNHQLPKETYVPSWIGLRTLLCDLGRSPLAKEYFDFMHKY